MMTDIPESVVMVPIERIEVLNSRDRNMKVFEETARVQPVPSPVGVLNKT